MSERAPLRVVATHDFCCAYSPSPTSYGSLPGGEGLKDMVDALRAQGPTVRADAGDFAAPGALATLSGGKAGFAAAADLEIDVGVVGNHEFEWGLEHLRTHAAETGFPLLSANAPEVGLPPTAVVDTDMGIVGFIGLTCPDPGAYVSAPDLDPDLAGVAIRHAEELRASGADWVVMLLHDGVDWPFGARGYEAHPERFSGVCKPWAQAVDAIFASHTLGRWIGRVEGTPVVQPWPFGAELGVVELEVGEEPMAYCVTPETGGRWGGSGNGLLDDASTRVLGELAEPLGSRSGGPAPLADFFARALRKATGARAAGVDMLASQAPVDGVLSYLPAGPVTEADILRLYPWPDATVAGEVEGEELRKVAQARWLKPWAAWGFDAADWGGARTATLAVLEGDALEHVERALGRRVEWRRTDVGLREAVARTLS
ncbi:MAG: 5'-nucleotidase C-terminal domain-containing protein [Actinomycetota bacterium]|nr:5'-nucleotidase C-terminal domain-containing protein [Actinomycetota bacterium]